jgi:hypothetical protein
MNQIRFATDYFVNRFPSIRQVVTIVAPEDLSDCATTNPRVFNPQDVDDLVYGRGEEFWLYLKYFDPMTLAKNALMLKNMREGGHPLDVMTINRFGDSPLDTSASREDLVYGTAPPPDPVCLDALRRLAAELDAKNVSFIVVTMPLSPLWKAQYDPDGSVMRNLTQKVEGALAGSTTRFWDADRDFPMNPGDFIDAIHVRWSAARTFSRALVVATGLGNPLTAAN